MLTISKERFDALYAYAAMLANAEMLTMGATNEPHSYSLADINFAGSTMLDILDSSVISHKESNHV